MTFGMVVLALTLGLDVFAGGLSLGVNGLERRRWARTALLFATLTFLMMSLGVLFGRLLDDSFGRKASYIAGAVLLVVGLRAVADKMWGETDHDQDLVLLEPMDILLTGVMVCMDKLAIGVTLAFVDVSITPLIAYLVVQSFVVTMLGLVLGDRLGVKIGEAAAVLAGLIFAVLGLLIILQTAMDRSYI